MKIKLFGYGTKRKLLGYGTKRNKEKSIWLGYEKKHKGSKK
jgi:hypothetical protein